MASYVRRHDHSDRDRLLKELRSVGSGSARGEHPLVSNLRKLVAFEHFTFSGLDLDGFRVGRGVHLATNMPERFLRGYLSQGCIDVDPLMRRSTEASPLAVWDSVSEQELRDPAVRPLNELLHDCEIADRAGLSFWRDGRAFGVAVFTRRQGFTEAELATLTAFAGPIHDVFAQRAMERLNGMLAISPGELRCLEWAAKGLTSEEIARETRYAPDTVTTYLKSAIKKFGAFNRTQAVAEAIRRRIIH